MIKMLPKKIPFTFQKYIWDVLGIGNNQILKTSKFIFISLSFQVQNINTLWKAVNRIFPDTSLPWLQTSRCCFWGCPSTHRFQIALRSVKRKAIILFFVTEKKQIWPQRTPLYTLICSVLWTKQILGKKKNWGGRVGRLIPKKKKGNSDTYLRR